MILQYLISIPSIPAEKEKQRIPNEKDEKNHEHERKI